MTKTWLLDEMRQMGQTFSKEGDSRFHIWNYGSGKSLGRKVHFFNSFETTIVSEIFKLSVYIHVGLFINFSEQVERCFYFKYQRVIKFYNLGHESFGTDISTCKIQSSRNTRDLCWTIGHLSCLLIRATEYICDITIFGDVGLDISILWVKYR